MGLLKKMVLHYENLFAQRPIRGGGFSDIFTNLASGDLFQGSARDLGHSLFTAGKKYVTPLIKSGYESLKPQLKDIGKDILDSGTKVVQKQAEKFITDLGNANSKADLKKILAQQKKDFKESGTKIGQKSVGDLQQTLITGIRDLPKNTGVPAFDKKQERISALLDTAKSASDIQRLNTKPTIPIAKTNDTSAIVSSIINGSGNSRAKRGKNSGDGLYRLGYNGRGLMRL